MSKPWHSRALLVAALALVGGAAWAQPVNYLPEGAMTGDGPIPAGWSTPTAEKGEIVASRDATVYKEGPASLRLELRGAGARGSIAHPAPGILGKRLAVSAWLRTEGEIRGVTIALVVPGREQSWFPVIAWGRASDWRLVRGKVALPADGGEPSLVIMAEGEGRVWMDEVALEPAETYPPDPVAVRFSAPFLFGYGDWQGGDSPLDDGRRIAARSGRGGLGIATDLDLTPFAAWTPALRLVLGAANQARSLRMTLGDSDGTQQDYRFALAGRPVGEPVTIPADEGASLLEPSAVTAPGEVPGFDLTRASIVIIQGDWGGEPVDVALQQLEMVEPDAATLAQREQLRQRVAKEAEDRRLAAERDAQAKRDLLTNGAPHPADGPDVRHVSAVAPDVIALTIQEKEYVRVGEAPYVPLEGDEIVHEGEPTVLAWEGGKMVEVPLGVSVRRKDPNGQVLKLGDLAVNAGTIKPGDASTGADLLLTALTEPAAYRISSADDPAYAAPTSPAGVSWKRKPNAPHSLAMEAHIYLRLARPLVAGKTYHIELLGINTRQAVVDYTHDTAVVRSESVHVSCVGFRPDDPYKRLFLSLWMGTGGPYSFAGAAPLRFQVLEQATGRSAFEGTLSLVRGADAAENNPPARNYAQADVYTGDFSALTRPGTYRCWVEGIGCSYPFEIGPATWEGAFRVSMLGFLQQRSGIALGPPLLSWSHPRDMHPADGFHVLASTFSPFYTSADQGGMFLGLFDPKNRTTKEMPAAWGGYHDAGDWDRNADHLLATWQLLDLYDLFPAYFDSLKLSLPDEEARNGIPDVLDEALWNLELFRRLQAPDGGVSAGIEMTAHPRPGEASWQNSLANFAMASDPPSSLVFAAAAAKFARVAARHAPELAAAYREAALKAWDWAEADLGRVAASSPEGRKRAEDPDRVLPRLTLAAAELLWLTGEPRFAEAFASSTAINGDDFVRRCLQRDANFTYARLPEGLGDQALKGSARAAVLEAAEAALLYGDGNSFGLTTDLTMPPMGWVGFTSKPGMVSRELPRAYLLTGDGKYLAGAIRACQFAVGANPENLAFTTGLGPNPVKWPLHIDSSMAGQPTPPGITVCGNSDPAMNYDFDGWAHTWLLAYGGKMVPDSRTWPMYESYWDVYDVPSTNEYQPHFLAQSAYYWGFLAARGPVAAPPR